MECEGSRSYGREPFCAYLATAVYQSRDIQISIRKWFRPFCFLVEMKSCGSETLERWQIKIVKGEGMKSIISKLLVDVEAAKNSQLARCLHFWSV